jgi:hypothetical protein
MFRLRRHGASFQPTLGVVWLLSADVKHEKRISELVSNLHPPVVTGPQFAIDVLKNLPRYHGAFFPRCVLVRQLLALVIGLVGVVLYVEEISRHARQCQAAPEVPIGNPSFCRR